jgi:hypothetical protein
MRKMIACMACLAMVASVSAKELQSLSNGMRVTPQKVASFKLINGQAVQTGEWVAYEGDTRGCCDSNIAFDSFEAEGSCPTAGPIGGDCITGGTPDSRWFFGPSYCNGASTNDMTVVSGKEGEASERIQFAWYWYGDGNPVNSEDCIIAAFTGEAFAQDCTGFGSAYSGVGYSFGPLTNNPGGYYYTEVDLCGSGLFHQMPAAADGWYQMLYLTTGNAPATCAQSMLWGQVDTSVQGFSGELQYDDDNPRDQAYELPTECYSYAFGLCPSDLGAMTAFYTAGGGGDPCADNGCTGGACDFKKLSCRRGKLKAKGTGTPGDSVCITDADGNFDACATVKDTGKWVKKLGTFTGAQTRSACGETKTANCG